MLFFCREHHHHWLPAVRRCLPRFTHWGILCCKPEHLVSCWPTKLTPQDKRKLLLRLLYWACQYNRCRGCLKLLLCLLPLLCHPAKHLQSKTALPRQVCLCLHHMPQQQIDQCFASFHIRCIASTCRLLLSLQAKMHRTAKFDVQ